MANAAALVEEQEAAEIEAATALMVADARAKRKKAAEDRVAGEEEERLAGVDLHATLEAEGRKKTAAGRYLSGVAAAQGTRNRNPTGRRAKKNKKKAAQKVLAAVKEAVTVQQSQLAAERAAFALQQRSEGVQLDAVQLARAATAAIEDPQTRKKHERLVDSGERYVTQLAAVTEDPVRIRNRMSGAVSAVVTDSKKITKDDQRRTANDRRAAQRQGDKTSRKENYNSKHLANPKSQNKWRKQSRQNKVAKRKNRAEQAKKKAVMRGPRTNRPRR
jgi:hypothetical protein